MDVKKQALMIEFLCAQHVVHLSTSADNVPWCAPLFYALNKEAMRLIVASKEDTRHAQEALKQRHIAASIALQSECVGEIRGVQARGIWKQASKHDKRCYFERFPYARALFPKLWAIELVYVKFTDNRLGFGKKFEFHFTRS